MAVGRGYHHLQVGTLLLAILGGGFCLLGLSLVVAGFNRIVLVALACLESFATLTMTIDDGAVHLRCGRYRA